MRKLVGADVEPVYAEPRAGDVRDSQADITKARELLGYEPDRRVRRGPAQDRRLVSLGGDGSGSVVGGPVDRRLWLSDTGQTPV